MLYYRSIKLKLVYLMWINVLIIWNNWSKKGYVMYHYVILLNWMLSRMWLM